MYEAYKTYLLKDLPDEIWKDIKDYEGYYKVSNYGRIKSISRYVEHARLGQQLIHSRILTQNIKKSSSKHFENYYVDCQVALTKYNSTKNHSVKRLVYASFIEPQNFKKDNMCIVHKDYNGYNNHIENLEKISYKERFKRIKGRGRFYNSLQTADRSLWPKTYGGYSRMIPIKHISPHNQTTSYKSIREASRKLNIDASEISKLLKGKRGLIKGNDFKYL